MKPRKKWSNETEDDHLDFLHNYPQPIASLALPCFSRMLVLNTPIPIIDLLILILTDSFTLCSGQKRIYTSNMFYWYDIRFSKKGAPGDNN